LFIVSVTSKHRHSRILASDNLPHLTRIAAFSRMPSKRIADWVSNFYTGPARFVFHLDGDMIQ
jgi:hypothetical protein